MKVGQQVEHASTSIDNLGTVSAVNSDGWVRVVWRQGWRGKARMRVWYPPEALAKFIHPANYRQR